MSKIILALESGGPVGSVALHLADGQIRWAQAPSGQSHSSGLLPLAETLLVQAGLAWTDVQGYALGSGPGSFTGLRISCGLIQGLAFAANTPTVAISSFEAWSTAWWAQHQPKAPTVLDIGFDARLGEAYAARLLVGPAGMEWILEPRVVPFTDRVLALPVVHDLRPAAHAHDTITLLDPKSEDFPKLVMPLAGWVAKIAADDVRCPPARWQRPALLKPLYVRDKVAMTRDERQAHPDLSWSLMTDRDLASVMVIEHQAYPFPWTSGNFQDALNAGYEMWVLKERGVMIGYLVWMRVVDEAHLLNFTLSPARQGRGMGSWMLNWLMNEVRKAGMKKLLLEVRPSNLPAIRLYEKFGFATIGVRQGYYPNTVGPQGPGSAQSSARENAFVMERLLTAS
jgi:tRNA threonylcarbamoyladenosine biosynthesis protein TsaB